MIFPLGIFFIALYMNRTSIYYFSLSALLAGGFVSCQEDNQGFDYETIKRAKYERDFKSVFGEVAANHDFGFDHAALAMGLSAPVTRGDFDPIEVNNMDDYVWKQNATRTYNGYGNIKAEELYGMPKDITQHEHDEVFAWFSNHQVDWAVTPTNLDQVGTSRICKDANGNEIKDSDGKYLVIAHTIKATNPNYGSLANYSSNPLSGDYTSQDPLFYNGWIQNVNWDETEETSVGGHKYTGKNMNYLAFQSMDYPDQWVHLLDFNGDGTGYGWNSQFSGGQKFNAELVMGSKFNNVVYKCSADSHQHDKYLLVYLKGDDYEGWYLGLDFEGYEVGASIDHNSNKVVPADGICNDWILKIGDAGATPFNPSRVMCEDLGTNDFDFNDIVYEVQSDPNNDYVIVTVHAVGGTIPVQLRYDAKANGSSQPYQVFSKNGKEEMHDIFGARVNQPVKVNAPGGLDNPVPYTVTWYLKFKTNDTGNSNYWDGQVNHPVDYYFSSSLNLSLLNVYVQHEDVAEWINLNNRDGNVPLKFCVPMRDSSNNIVKWTKEGQRITKAYNQFDEWLANSRVLFWNAVSDASVLFTPAE